MFKILSLRKWASFIFLRRIITFTGGLILLMAILFLIWIGIYLLSPVNKGDDDQIFYVQQGSTLREVVFTLEQKGLIKRRALFLVCARLMGHSKRIKAGEYMLNTAMSPMSILRILSRGEIITYTITIPEGLNIRQIGELLVSKGLVDLKEFLSMAGSLETAVRYDISESTLEGYLYPDTYQFSRGISADTIIHTMVRRFFEVFAPFRERVKQSGMSVEEVIILASIVEKETGLAEERPLISSVFLNRLKKGMRLESDPTVIYGIQDFNGNLTRKDLATPTPYNTYLIRGLPPGPIANPGREAIRAVLYPAQSNYLYFVSKNDGSHHFSSTLQEHNRAVEIYQKRRYFRKKSAT